MLTFPRFPPPSSSPGGTDLQAQVSFLAITDVSVDTNGVPPCLVLELVTIPQIYLQSPSFSCYVVSFLCDNQILCMRNQPTSPESQGYLSIVWISAGYLEPQPES